MLFVFVLATLPSSAESCTVTKGELHQHHPLLKLGGRRVAEYTIGVEAWPGRFVGQAEFVVYLKGPAGETSDGPVVEGLYGRTTIPGSGGSVERGILDITLASEIRLGDTRIGLRERGLDREIVGGLAVTIADVWSAMMYLAYGWKTLKQIQELHHPVQVTDEGYLLFTHGFRGGWKDYYYSEGWWEGPIKLKAERPPTAEYRELWDADNARVLLDFLKRPPAEGHLQFQEEGSSKMVTLPIVAVERSARARALLMVRDLALVGADLVDDRARVLAVYPFPQALEGLSLGELDGLGRKARGEG